MNDRSWTANVLVKWMAIMKLARMKSALSNYNMNAPNEQAPTYILIFMGENDLQL